MMTANASTYPPGDMPSHRPYSDRLRRTVSVSFQNNPGLVGRLGSEPRFVRQLGSGVRVYDSLQTL